MIFHCCSRQHPYRLKAKRHQNNIPSCPATDTNLLSRPNHHINILQNVNTGGEPDFISFLYNHTFLKRLMSYSYEAVMSLISISPCVGQPIGGSSFSFGSSSGAMVCSNARILETAPIDVSDRAQQKIMVLNVELNEIRLTKPTPVNPEL
jgi:hypothetical protein